LIGEQFCVDAGFSNTDSNTGFGPYLTIIVEPEIQGLSVEFVDIAPKLEQIGVFDGSGVLVDPITGANLSGVDGGSAWTARYPLGSIDQGQPALVMSICAVVEPGAPIDVAKNLEIIPGFEFGDSTLGTNGPISGTPFSSTVTPQLARISKSNSAPEGERPPGPSHPFQYTWTADVSEGETIENLVLDDTLPPGIEWTGDPINVTAPLGNGCIVAQDPSTPPGGLVSVTCDSLLGAASTNDLSVSVPVYISDVLDQASPASISITNTVTFDFDYQGSVQPQKTSDSTVEAVHAAVQKSVSGTGLPGGILTYSINFQLTDYSDTTPGADTFLLSDIIADGLRYDTTAALIVNNSSVPIAPTVIPGPGAGETSLAWDVSAAVGGPLAPGASGSITYEVTILDTYDNGDPVLSSDSFPNTAVLDYELGDGAVGRNDSTISQPIEPNLTDKIIASPNPLPDVIQPGDPIVFELSMDIRAGNTANVTFTDYLPRPVFDVADFNPATDLEVMVPFAGLTPTVSTDSGTNSIALDFGDISTTITTKLRVRLTARVVGTPFADNLFLTNLSSSSYENSNGTVIENLDAVSLTVGAPIVEITKGVIAADNPGAIITPAPPADPSTATADSNVSSTDAFDVVTYLLTVENIGSAPAFNVLIDDPGASGLNCAEPVPGDVINGNGNNLSFSGDLLSGILLDQALAANDGTPGPPYADDTALVTLRCTLAVDVEPRQTIVNEAGATWTSIPDPGTPPFARVSDTAEAVIADPAISKNIINVTPGYSAGAREAHVGELLTYELVLRVPEGTSSAVRVEDVLDSGLAFVDVLSITPSSSALSTSLGSFATVSANQGIVSQGGGVTAADRKLVFGPNPADNGFGTIVNSDNNNAVDETITVTYRARVLNASVNLQGSQRRNRASWLWQPPGESRQNVAVRARAIRIIEPLLQLRKQLAPDEGDENSPPRVSLTLNHQSGSRADAFDLALADALPETLFVDGPIDTSSCAQLPDSLTVSGGGLSDSVNAIWAEFPRGSTCTLSFQTRFGTTPNAGEQFQNCAELFWESLRDTDQPLPAPPTNILGVERTGDAADPGELNNYRLQACDVFSVFDVGIAKNLVATDQAHTDNIAGTPAGFESLTIGEVATFELVVTIPDAAVVPELRVVDLLPVTGNVLELISATTTFVGSGVVPTIANPVAVISDRDLDGVNDQVELNYGAISKLSDGVVDDDDRIRIAVVARVKDVLVNQNNDRTANDAIARFSGLTASDSFDLEVVEPLLRISKTADRSEAEAGDIVTYTLDVRHSSASRIDAKDLDLSDFIPAELNVVPGSVGVGPVCTEAPSSGPTLAAGIITANWATFPRSAVCEVSFEAVVDVSAVIGRPITNEAEILWTSLDGTGDADDRSYDLSDRWVLGISEPGLDKAMTATDVDATLFTLGDPSQELTIGETATFTVTANFSDGTTEAVNLRDQLPVNDVALAITGSRIVSIGADLTLSSGLIVGAPGTDCTGSAPQTCAEWALGDVVNLPDLRPDPDLDDSIVIEIDALVLDNPVNSGAPGEDKNLRNEALLTANNVTLSATEAFDLVEPQLQIRKLTENGSLPALVEALDIKRFTLEIQHRSDSTSTAVELTVTDTLDPEILWVNDSTVTSDCPGFAIDSSPAPGSSDVVTFSMSELKLVDRSCQISYDVQANGGLSVPDAFPNTADLQWYSAPLPNVESRQGTDSDNNRLISLSTATLSKVVTGTSVPDTTTSEGSALFDDLTIGERVSYRIVTAFSEGTTSNVVLTDTLQASAPDGPTLELITGNVIFIGDNITTSNPGTPSVGPANVVTVDYGTVLNAADGILDEDDTIVYELVARVVDVPNNVSGITLRNDVSLDYTGAAPPDTASVDIDVVEPALTANKTFTDLTEGVATIELILENTGNAAAYELTVTDDFDESYWIAGSLRPLSLPPGFTLSEASVAGTTTVTLATRGDPSKPEEVLAAGETLRVVFSMALVNGGIVGVTQIDNTANAEATSLPGIDPAERSYTATTSDSLFFPALSLEKTRSPNGPAEPGDTLTYTLTLENAGLAAATSVQLTDTPDPIGDFLVGSVVASAGGTVVRGNSPGDDSIEVTYATVAAAASATVTYEVQVPRPYPNGLTAPQELTNQASADAKEQRGIVSDDPDTPDPDDPTIVPINADPVMKISKDDQVLLTAPGAIIEYLITYANIGNQDATGVIVTETVPANTVYSAANSTAGWSCVDGSGPGTTCEFSVGDLSLTPGNVTFAVLVDTPLPPGVTQIDNLVEIRDDGVEFDPAAPVIPSTDSANEQTPIGGAFPQLDIEKDDGGIGVTPGQRYSYLINYQNIGNQGATGVVVTETVPDDVVFSAIASLPSRWSCPDGSPAGTACSITVPLLLARDGGQARFGLDVVFPAAAGRELIINNVDIRDDGGNSLLPSTDSDTDDTPLIAVPDIYVSKQTNATVVQAGDSIVYTAVYGNQGNQNATGVVVREAVPAGTTFNAANSAPTPWSCADGAPAGTVCEYGAGAVDAGFMETLIFAIDIVDTPDDRQIVNLIEANDDFTNGPDPVPGNNFDRVVNLFPSLSVDTMSRSALILLSIMMLMAAARQRHLRR
jgi:uncharacterized repeat protein (TIGR01451 family)